MRRTLADSIADARNRRDPVVISHSLASNTGDYRPQKHARDSIWLTASGRGYIVSGLPTRGNRVRMDSDAAALAQVLWNYLNLNGPLEKTDCIVGLGSYDLRVAERCADLYNEGWSPFIVFSGYLGNWTKAKWVRSEAEIFAEHAVARGIPADKIILERRSTNIGENLEFTKQLLLATNIVPESMTIVSKPSTERRILATSRRVWPEMPIFITSPKITFTEQHKSGIQDNLIHEMVGDIQRIKIYPSLGYQIPQDIPNAVWTAYESLIALGYDKHLIIDPSEAATSN